MLEDFSNYGQDESLDTCLAIKLDSLIEEEREMMDVDRTSFKADTINLMEGFAQFGNNELSDKQKDFKDDYRNIIQEGFNLLTRRKIDLNDQYEYKKLLKTVDLDANENVIEVPNHVNNNNCEPEEIDFDPLTDDEIPGEVSEIVVSDKQEISPEYRIQKKSWATMPSSSSSSNVKDILITRSVSTPAM